MRDPILRRPLGLVYTPEDIEAERENHHLVGIDEESAAIIAVLQLAPDPEAPGKLQMRQVAVSGDHRGRGAGRQLVEFSENFARELGVEEIWLHAREPVVRFYERLGYELVSDRFLEVGIPHFKMRKSLAR